MRATTDATLLGSALRDHVAQRTGTLPILQHVRLDARDGSLRVQSTDYELRVSTVIDATVEQSGALCPHAAKLTAAMTAGGEIRLEADADGMALAVRRGARSRLRVDALPATLWPVAETMTWNMPAFSGEQLAEAIDAVAYAAVRNDVRVFCNALCMGNGIAFGTNGHRAAIIDFPHVTCPVLIPTRALPILRKRLVEGAVVQFGRFGDNPPVSIAVEKGGNRIEVALLKTAHLPDIRATVPIRKAACTFTAPRAALIECVERAVPFCNRVTDKGVWNSALISHDGASLRIENIDRTSHEILEVPAEGKVAGGISLEYLATTLAAIPTDDVEIEIHGGGNDTIALIARAPKHPATHVVMGTRV